MARRQLELSNEVAAELAGAQDAILKTLEEHLERRDLPARQRGDPRRRRRGGRGRRDGRARAGRAGRAGHEIGPATIEAVTARARPAESPSQVLDDVVWRHRNLKVAPKSVNQKRYVDAIRELDDHVRRRSGGHRQDVPGHGDGRRRTLAPRGQPDHPDPPRGRGRRAARLPARRPDGEGRPVPAPAVRRAARHDGSRARRRCTRAGRHRGRAAGVHARPHAQRLVRDPRRGAEHVARADEDVPHPARASARRWSSPATSRRSTCRASSSPASSWSATSSRRRRHRVRALRRRGRRPPPARPADRRGLRRARRAPGAGAAARGHAPPPA